MEQLGELPCVKQGLWFHGGVTACHVRIVRHHVLQGSGQQDDPPELSHDQPADCYYILYDLPHAAGHWQQGGVALSLREAMFMAQRRLGRVLTWLD